MSDENLPSELQIFMKQIGILKSPKVIQSDSNNFKSLSDSNNFKSLWKPSYKDEEPPF